MNGIPLQGKLNTPIITIFMTYKVSKKRKRINKRKNISYRDTSSSNVSDEESLDCE